MMSSSEGEGGHGKADIVKEVARVLEYRIDRNADKGGRVKKSETLADIIFGSSLIKWGP